MIHIIDDLYHVIDFYVGDVHAQAVGIFLSFLGGIVEAVGFNFIFVALAVLGVDDCLIEIQIVVVGKQACAVVDGCLNVVGHCCKLFKWFNLCPLGLFDFYVHTRSSREKACKCKVWPKIFQAPALGIWFPAQLHPKFLEKF